MFLIHQICLASVHDSPPGRPLKQLSENRLLFLPLFCQIWGWYLDALPSAPNSCSGWIPCSERLVSTRVAPVLPHCCPPLNNLDRLACVMEWPTVLSYRRCSLREGGQNSCYTEKNPLVEQFTKVRLIFLGSEKSVNSCSKVKKLCLVSLKSIHSRSCHSGLQAEFLCTREGRHDLAWLWICTLRE